jgi:carbon monoxide dehydrogenase subunit G
LRVEGTYSFSAGKQQVWDSLLSPDVLFSCIPGCEKFEQAGEDSYDVVMRIGVAAVSGTYTGKVSVTDKNPMESYKMRVEGRGSGGSIKGEGVLSFSENSGETHVRIVGDAQVSGMVARVGQRLLGNASKMLMNQFFDCLKYKVG